MRSASIERQMGELRETLQRQMAAYRRSIAEGHGPERIRSFVHPAKETLERILNLVGEYNLALADELARIAIG